MVYVGGVNFKRIGNTIQVECESESETAKAFSVLLATRILLTDDFSPFQKAILSDLDSLAKELLVVSRAAQLRGALAPFGIDSPNSGLPGNKHPLLQE